jgi:hypothetical protein
MLASWDAFRTVLSESMSFRCAGRHAFGSSHFQSHASISVNVTTTPPTTAAAS